MSVDGLLIRCLRSAVSVVASPFWECLVKSIQDSMINEEDYVELEMAYVDVCTTLRRGLNRKPLKDLSDSVCGAINQLTT